MLGARDADDAYAALPSPWTRPPYDVDDDAADSCALGDDDDLCEPPLHGRPNRPSTPSPDADDADGELPREPDVDDAESASLPPSRADADDAERPWLPSSADDDAGPRLLHAPSDDGGAWGLRTSCDVWLWPFSAFPWVRELRPGRYVARRSCATTDCVLGLCAIGDAA